MSESGHLGGKDVAKGYEASIKRMESMILALIMRAGGYFLAITGMVFSRPGDRFRLLSLPRGFIAINVAAIIRIFQALATSSTEIWTPDRNWG